jgi:hypothetical protein
MVRMISDVITSLVIGTISSDVTFRSCQDAVLLFENSTIFKKRP